MTIVLERGEKATVNVRAIKKYNEKIQRKEVLKINWYLKEATKLESS